MLRIFVKYLIGFIVLGLSMGGVVVSVVELFGVLLFIVYSVLLI